MFSFVNLQHRSGVAAEMLPSGRSPDEHELAAHRYRLRQCHAADHRAVREEQHGVASALFEVRLPTRTQYAAADRQFLLLCKYTIEFL